MTKPPSVGLTPKEELFCQRIVAGDNGPSAAINAGYSVKRAGPTASELIRKRKITERISVLRDAARRIAATPNIGPVTPDVSAIVLDRAYLVRRLLEMQHGYRDSVAFNAIKLLGQEEFQMFGDLVVMTDPSRQSTDDLEKMRDKIRRKHGLGS